jgi:cell division protease FtsH
VTIVPRGRALGLTAQLPVDDRHNYSKSYLEGMLAILMGGRVAEHLLLDQKTTGAGNDIERARGIARKMVCEWGMSDKLGPLTFGKKSEEIFVGREFGMHRDFSEDMAKKIDAEVKSFVEKGEKLATKIIKSNMEYLIKISERLIEVESVSGRDIDIILGREVEDEKPRRNPRSRQQQGRSRNPNQRKPRKQVEHKTESQKMDSKKEISKEVKKENTVPKLIPPPPIRKTVKAKSEKNDVKEDSEKNNI